MNGPAEPLSVCGICGANLVRCEAGELCAKGCNDALLDAVEAYYDACRPDGAPADADSKLRTAITAFWKARAAFLPVLPTDASLRECAQDLLHELPGTVGERVAIERLRFVCGVGSQRAASR